MGPLARAVLVAVLLDPAFLLTQHGKCANVLDHLLALSHRCLGPGDVSQHLGPISFSL